MRPFSTVVQTQASLELGRKPQSHKPFGEPAVTADFSRGCTEGLTPTSQPSPPRGSALQMGLTVKSEGWPAGAAGAAGWLPTGLRQTRFA